MFNSLPTDLKILFFTFVSLHFYYCYKWFTSLAECRLCYAESTGWHIFSKKSDGSDTIDTIKPEIINRWLILLNYTIIEEGTHTLLVMSDAIENNEFSLLVTALKTENK